MSKNNRSSLSEKTGPIILKALKQYLEEIKMAAPGDVQVPPELFTTVDGDVVNQETAIAKWINIIDRIVYAFNDNVSVNEFGAIWEEDDDGNIIISNKEKFRKFELAQEEHEARVRLGMKLFAKHYDFL